MGSLLDFYLQGFSSFGNWEGKEKEKKEYT
jgi:hypothetical protein